MLKTGLLNPHVLSLVARVRHTNALVIADRGFPFWPMIETVDLSLVDGVPTVLQVLEALRPNFVIGEAFMAEEFLLKYDALDEMDPRMAPIWAWHAIEESEHKAVAFDVYKAVGGSEFVRITEMMAVSVMFPLFSAIHLVRSRSDFNDNMPRFVTAFIESQLEG